MKLGEIADISQTVIRPGGWNALRQCDHRHIVRNRQSHQALRWRTNTQVQPDADAETDAPDSSLPNTAAMDQGQSDGIYRFGMEWQIIEVFATLCQEAIGAQWQNIGVFHPPCQAFFWHGGVNYASP
ncbi:MAG: hypothetical protein JNM56_15305 [Planctomycetia bacterium]|nr:hypothetical protein [Planctomycetia bacterium]